MKRILFCFLIGITLCAGLRFAHAEERSKVVVKVNGVAITLNEVEEEINRIISQTVYHRQVTPEKREALRKDAIERLVERELEYQEARKQGIKAEKEKTEERVEELKKKFPSEEAFIAALKKNNLTLKRYEERIAKDLVIEKILLAEVESKSRVGDDEVKAFYEKNVERYKEPEMIKIRHIMILADPAKGDEEREKARKRAGEMLKKAKAGEDFAALASEYSEDSYKVKGGELGYVARGSMEPEAEKAAFGLAIGEVMGPLETEYGFYIIKVEDKRPEHQMSFDEVKEKIKKEMESKRKEERRQEWVSSLRAKAKIEYR
jgi:peptidyl-prolyl cis-trans isomerase C